jgi:lysozyme
MMTTTLLAGPLALALIKRFEGCGTKLPDGRLKAYPDPATHGGPWTIGWGSTGADVKPGTIWTQKQADDRLANDVARFAAKVAGLLAGPPTTQAQFDALVSLAYNIGVANLASSTLLRLHNAGNRAAAAEQFARWNKAAGKVLAGLTRRRAAEASVYLGKGVPE